MREHNQHCPDCGEKMNRSEGTIVTFSCPECSASYNSNQLEIIETHTPAEELPY